MIVEYGLVSITIVGEEALQKNLDEFSHLPFYQKIQFNRVYRRIVTHDPLALSIKVKNTTLGSILVKDDLLKHLELSMFSEGAKRDVDYRIVLVEK